MDTFILDYNVWRCGALEPLGSGRRLGKGHTSLLNEEGYMCCLGQFMSQLYPEVDKEVFLLESAPCSIRFYDKPSPQDSDCFRQYQVGGIGNTELAESAMEINDEPYTTVLEKVKALIELFEDYGFGIELKNFPDAITKELQ